MWRNLSLLKGVNTNDMFGPPLNKPIIGVKSGDDYVIDKNY